VRFANERMRGPISSWLETQTRNPATGRLKNLMRGTATPGDGPADEERRREDAIRFQDDQFIR